MTDIAEEKTTLNTENTETGPEGAQAMTDAVLEAQIKAAAMAYAKYLKDNDFAPGDATFAEPEELGVDFDALEAEAEAAGLDFEMEEPPAEEEPEQEERPSVLESLKQPLEDRGDRKGGRGEEEVL